MNNYRKLTALASILTAALVPLVMYWLAEAIYPKPCGVETPLLMRVVGIGALQILGLYLLLALRREFTTLLVNKGTRLLLNLWIIMLASLIAAGAVWFVFGGPSSANIFASNYITLMVLFMNTVIIIAVTALAFGIALALNRSLSSRLLRSFGAGLALAIALLAVNIFAGSAVLALSLILLAAHFWQPTRHIDIV